MSRAKALKAFLISERNGDSVTEGIQKIVLPVAVRVAYTETFDLLNEVISCFLLVGRDFIESVIAIFNGSPIHITRHVDCPFVLAHGGQF